VRRRRLRDGATPARGGLVANARIMDALVARRDSASLTQAGLRTLLLAGWARESGLVATRTEREVAEREFFEERGIPRAQRAGFLARAGLDAAEAARLFDTLALEGKVLQDAARMISDGPSTDEALALQARLTGLWARVAARR
jgi:hypothetical protein